jgi:hypothetical protein
MWYDLAKYIHNYVTNASEIYIINYVDLLKHEMSQKQYLVLQALSVKIRVS